MRPRSLQVELSNFHYVLRLCHRSPPLKTPFISSEGGLSLSPSLLPSLPLQWVDNAITKRGRREGAPALMIATPREALLPPPPLLLPLSSSFVTSDVPSTKPSPSPMQWGRLGRLDHRHHRHHHHRCCCLRRWQCPSRHPLCFPSVRPRHRQRQQQEEGAGGSGGVERARYCAGQGSVDTAQGGGAFCSFAPS